MELKCACSPCFEGSAFLEDVHIVAKCDCGKSENFFLITAEDRSSLVSGRRNRFFETPTDPQTVSKRRRVSFDQEGNSGNAETLRETAQLRRRLSDLEAERPPLSPIAHDEQYSYISTKEQKRRSLEFVNRQQDTENNVTCRRKRKTETASGHSISLEEFRKERQAVGQEEEVVDQEDDEECEEDQPPSPDDSLTQIQDSLEGKQESSHSATIEGGDAVDLDYPEHYRDGTLSTIQEASEGQSTREMSREELRRSLLSDWEVNEDDDQNSTSKEPELEVNNSSDGDQSKEDEADSNIDYSARSSREMHMTREEFRRSLELDEPPMLFLEDSDLEGDHPPSGLPEIRVEAPSDMSLEESAMSGAPRGERPLDEDSRRQNSNMSTAPSNAEGTETTEGRSSRIKDVWGSIDELGRSRVEEVDEGHDLILMERSSPNMFDEDILRPGSDQGSLDRTSDEAGEGGRYRSINLGHYSSQEGESSLDVSKLETPKDFENVARIFDQFVDGVTTKGRTSGNDERDKGSSNVSGSSAEEGDTDHHADDVQEQRNESDEYQNETERSKISGSANEESDHVVEEGFENDHVIDTDEHVEQEQIATEELEEGNGAEMDVPIFESSKGRRSTMIARHQRAEASIAYYQDAEQHMVVRISELFNRRIPETFRLSVQTTEARPPVENKSKDDLSIYCLPPHLPLQPIRTSMYLKTVVLDGAVCHYRE